MAQAEGDGDQAGAPAWRSCWPTADETTLSLCCPLEAGGPWLWGRALDVLRSAGEVRPDPSRQRYATSPRRGAPLILGEPLLWHRLPVIMEACQAEGQSTGEVTLRLPPWAEMAEELAEEILWRLADDLAEELRAHCAVISDGSAIGYPDLGRPERAAANLQRSHLGVVVPRAWLGFLRGGSNIYRELARSELSVVLE